MLSPQVIVMDRLQVPVLVEVLRAKSTLSLRLYEEIGDGGDLGRTGRVSGRVALDGVPDAGAVIGTQAGKSVATPSRAHPAPSIPGDALNHSGKDFMVLDEMLFDFGARSGLGKEWGDHAAWVFPLRPDGTLDTPFNRSLATWLSKIPESLYRARENRPYPLRLMVPFKTCGLDQSSLVINTHPDYGMIGNIEPTWTLPADAAGIPREMVFPSLKLTGPATVAPDEAATITVAVVDKDGAVIADAACELPLEVVSGYLPKARVAIVNGGGTFKVMALGLEAGEAVRVKAGLGLFTGLADISIPVA